MSLSYREYGAIGFGLGGIIVAFSGDFMVFGVLIMGALGSALITIPARNWKLTLFSTLFGGLSFFIGFTIPLFVFLTYFEIPFGFLLIGLLMGVLTGLMLGMVFQNLKDFLRIGTIGGGLSFGLCLLLLDLLRPTYPNEYSPIVIALILGIGGITCGAFFGHAASLSKFNQKRA